HPCCVCRVDCVVLLCHGSFFLFFFFFFFFQAEDGIRDFHVTGVQTCALPISSQWAQEDFRMLTTVLEIRERALRDANRERSRHRSEERRVGKECRSRWSAYH